MKEAPLGSDAVNVLDSVNKLDAINIFDSFKCKITNCFHAFAIVTVANSEHKRNEFSSIDLTLSLISAETKPFVEFLRCQNQLRHVL